MMQQLKVKLIQNMAIQDYPWLHRDLFEGEEFYVYKGPTYGCISKNGIALTEKLDVNPYFEVPKKFVVFK